MTDFVKNSGAFVRIPWSQIHDFLIEVLHEKYHASGRIEYKRDYGCYEGIHDAYEMPHFVDVYLDQDEETDG